MQLTSNTRPFIEAEQYSDFILMNLEDGLLPDSFYRDVKDFMTGETLHIKTVGEVTLQESEENVALEYTAIETGEVTFSITEYIGDAWYITDDLREEGTQVELLAAQRSAASTRALQERFETDFLATAAGPFEAATDGVAINGFDHFMVSAETNNIFSLEHFIAMKLAFDKANVPESGRIFIVDPIVEATLNSTVSITNDVTPFAQGIMEKGLANGQRFLMNFFGWDILTSNRLHIADANDGTTTLSGAVMNLAMCVLDDQTKPVMGAWRRAPGVEGDRDFSNRRDKFQTTTRYGFGVQRIDTLGCVATSATNYK